MCYRHQQAPNDPRVYLNVDELSIDEASAACLETGKIHVAKSTEDVSNTDEEVGRRRRGHDPDGRQCEQGNNGAKTGKSERRNKTTNKGIEENRWKERRQEE